MVRSAPAREVERHATLIYDGDCGFCTRWVKWAEKRLPASVAITSSTSIDLAPFGVTSKEAAAAAWWIDPDGRKRRGHEAIAKVLTEFGGAWRGLGILLVTPPVSWCAAGGYALVARFRSRLPGGSPTCRVPWR